MATFTMRLKDVIKVTGGTTEIVDGVTKLTGGDIGIQHFEIFDPDYKDTLIGKFVDHYWNEEIGFETVEMFQMAMRSRLNEIMPYMNKLYQSELLALDPLTTVDMKTTSTGETNQTATQASTSETGSDTTSVSRAVNSTTPQIMLSGNGQYATSGADAKGDTTSTGSGSDSANSSANADSLAESETKGRQGSASLLLQQYRDTFMNLDVMVINQLADLFMLVYGNNDEEYSRRFIGIGWIY